MEPSAPASSVPTAPVTRFDIRSRDPEFAHDQLRRTYADFTVEHAARSENFEFAHAGSVVPEIVTARTHYAMRAHMDTRPPPGAIIVTTLLGGRMEIGTTRGDPVTAERGTPVLLAPDEPQWGVRVENPHLDAMILDRAVLDRQASSLLGTEANRLRFSSMTPFSPALARFWRGVADHVGRVVLADAELAGNPLVLAETGRVLANATLAAFPNTALALVRDPGWVGTAVVRRAVDYIEQHAHEPITLAEIAAAARVGARSLQHAFRAHQATTPLGYLRRVRLGRAHYDLQVADPTRGDTVGRIAARWGFSNPGRFSGTYLAAYGCSPSTTLRS